MRILKIVPQAFYSTRGTPLSAYHRARELVAVGKRANLFNEAHQIPRLDRILISDSIATISVR